MAQPLSNEVWVVGDLRSQKLFGFGLGVLAKAREISRDLETATRFVIIGPAGQTAAECPWAAAGQVPVEAAESDAVRHGADHVMVLETAAGDDFRADIQAAVVADLVKTRRPGLVLFALTDFGREAAARAARICGSGLIADCFEIRVEDGRIVADCPAWGGEIIARITFSDSTATGFATVAPHAFRPVTQRGRPGAIEHLAPRIPAPPVGIELLSRAEASQTSRRLESAQVVVVGGAGLGSADGFDRVRELASALGGQVGATRPPVLEHWAAEERLIGQTGKTVSPQLLLSIGTSGAVQYTAGIAAADTIVAVNRDPGAPIFALADIGVVADTQTFLPVLTKRVKQAVMRRLADDLCTDESRQTDGKDRFGERIKKLRQANGWTEGALARATGQTPEFIRSVETGQVSPPVSFLIRLAKALGVDAGTFLHKSEKAIVRDQRAQAFNRRTQNYSYQTLTPSAENDHLRAFMVTIDSHRTHKPVAYKHEGEEFIFVMDGSLEFTLGGKAQTLKSGEYIHFNSDIPHKLKNLSNRPTRCLVVLYTT